MLGKVIIMVSVFVLVFGLVKAPAQDTIDKTCQILELEWANDIFMSTDRYFTNGLVLKYYSSFLKKSPSSFILLPDKKGEITYHGITLTQHFFTPVISYGGFSPDDRPFASYLLLGHQKVSLNPKKRIKKQSEIQIGILGRYSGGESIQNWIHELLPASEPVIGWDNQLNADFALNYLLKFEHGLFNTKSFDLMSVADVRLGVPYTDVAGGLKIRIGRFDDYFSNIGIDTEKDWQLYLFAEADVKYVAYNATLQGGLSHNSLHIINEIEPLMVQSHIGIVFTKNSFGVELGQYIQSPDFSRGLPHAWGYMVFRYAF